MTDVTDVTDVQAMTVAVPDIEVQKKPGVPLWVIIVAVVGGVLLLIILIVLLWKVRHRSSCLSLLFMSVVALHVQHMMLIHN